MNGEESAGSAGRGEAWVLLLQRGSADALYEAAAMTAAAASLGIAVTLVWFDEALEGLVSGRLEESAEEEEASAGRLLALSRETGRVRFLACSASMVRVPSRAERVRRRVDDVVGWPTVIGLIRAAEKAFVW